MSTQKRIGWDALAERAGRMTDAQIRGALIAAGAAATAARTLDEVFETDDEEHYRDKASMLGRERDLRLGFIAERRRVEDSPQASEVAPRATIGCPVPTCQGTAHPITGEPVDQARKPFRCDSCGVAFYLHSQQYWTLSCPSGEPSAAENPKK